MRRLKLRLPSGKATSHRRVPRSGDLDRDHSLGPTETRPLQKRQSACLPRLHTREKSERHAAVLLKHISANEPTGSNRSAESQLLRDCSKVLTHYPAKTWRRGSESVGKHLLTRHLCQHFQRNQACRPLPFHPSPVPLWCPFWCPFPGTCFPARGADRQHPLQPRSAPPITSCRPRPASTPYAPPSTGQANLRTLDGFVGCKRRCSGPSKLPIPPPQRPACRLPIGFAPYLAGDVILIL